MPDSDSGNSGGSAVKPGYQTTEFYSTLLTQVVAAIIAVSAVFGLKLDSSALQAAVPAVAVLAATLAQIFYSRSRSAVKVAALTSVPVSGAQSGAGNPAAVAAPVATTPVPLSGAAPTADLIFGEISADARRIFANIQALKGASETGTQNP